MTFLWIKYFYYLATRITIHKVASLD